MVENQAEPEVKLIKTQHPNVAKLYFLNPPANQLSGKVLMMIAALLEKAKKNQEIKALLVEGRGVFSVGADVKEIFAIAQEGNIEKALELLAQVNAVTDAIQNLGKPTIAIINGYCLGGGNELAMACDVRIATDENMTQFGQPEIKLGIMPGMGGTQRLPRLVDLEIALKLLFSGMFLSATDALKYGLVDKVVSKADIDAEAMTLAQQLILACPKRKQQVFDVERFDTLIVSDQLKAIMQKQSREAVDATLKAVRFGMMLPLEEALKLEQRLFAELVVRDSAKRGLAKLLKIDLPSEKVEMVKTDDKPKIDASGHEEELKMFREMIREFGEKEIRPRISEMEQKGIPREFFDKMGELGVYAASFPEEYGGAGLGKVAYCIAFEELARAYGSMAVLAGAHTGLACGSIYLGGNEAQKQKYLRAGVEGKMLGAFALTEPEAGSDACNIKTSAVKKDGGWLVNGSKRFITNGKDADFTIVIAQTDPFLKKDGLAAFIVETGWPGYKVSRIEHKLGIKGSQTVELNFQDLFVPDENLLGEVGNAFKIFMKSLNGGRLGLAAGCVGSSKRALELAFKHASERKQFEQPIIMNQAIQFYLARMRANIYLMEEATYNAARMTDQDKDTRLEAACVKLLCSEKNEWNVRTALQILGGDGYSDESEISRMLRDSVINTIFEGTNEIQQLLIFKEIYMSGGKI